MPTKKDLKRLIRARMEKTGESYTTARLRILEKDLPLPKEYARLAGMSDAAVRKATGREWLEWTRLLDDADASGLPHRDIVAMVGSHGVDGWWSQMVTVAYERFRGLREIGQRRGGGFDMNRSKTYPVPVDRLWAAWRDDGTRSRFVELDLELRTESENRSLRFRHEVEGTIALWFVDKGAKSSVQVQIADFPDRESMEAARERWGERLAALAAVLSG